MAAKKGNKNAEKWDKTTVCKILNEIYFDVQTDNIVYLNIVLAKKQLYSDIWNDWTNKFKDDKIVSLLIKRVESLIEANLLDQALHNKVNSKVAIFVLQNKYKWSDKQAIDHTSNGESIVWNEVKSYTNGKDSD
jgi:hypothetical protein